MALFSSFFAFFIIFFFRRMNFSRHFLNKISIHTRKLYIYNASYTQLAGKNIEHIKVIKLFKIKGINLKKVNM